MWHRLGTYVQEHILQLYLVTYIELYTSMRGQQTVTLSRFLFIFGWLPKPCPFFTAQIARSPACGHNQVVSFLAGLAVGSKTESFKEHQEP